MINVSMYSYCQPAVVGRYRAYSMAYTVNRGGLTVGVGAKFRISDRLLGVVQTTLIVQFYVNIRDCQHKNKTAGWFTSTCS